MIATFVAGLGAVLMSLVTVSTTVTTVSDPLNGSVLPKALPGGVMEYAVVFTNNSAVSLTSGSVVLSDPIPPNTKLYVGDLNGAGSGPVTFSQGLPGSGMTYTFTSLSSNTDDVDFSTDGGATWTYVPHGDASGFDTAVTNVRIKPKGTGAALGSFTMKFRVGVK